MGKSTLRGIEVSFFDSFSKGDLKSRRLRPVVPEAANFLAVRGGVKCIKCWLDNGLVLIWFDF